MKISDISAWLNVINKFFIVKAKVEKAKELDKPKQKLHFKVKGF